MRNLYRLEGFAKDSETLEEMVALEVCRRLTRRFTTDEKYIEGEIKNFGAYVQVFALVPEHITGKRVHEA